MIKRQRSITGYLCPKTRRHVFFILFICGIACALNGFAPHFAKQTAIVSGDTGTPLPILMYHSVLDNKNRESKYVITPADFEADLKLIQSKGYQTVTVSDLIAYKENKIALPEKPIMLTFDDGYYNNYSYVFPLLRQYNMKGVLSVVGKYADEYSKEGEVMNNNYSHATWKMLREMQESGVIEIENHSYDMHDWSARRGILKKKGEDTAHYNEVLLNDLTKMQEKIQNGVGTTAQAFTYPFGAVSKDSRAIVEKMGFKVTLGCEEGINYLTPGNDLKELKRFNRAGNANRDAFFKRVFKDAE